MSKNNVIKLGGPDADGIIKQLNEKHIGEFEYISVMARKENGVNVYFSTSSNVGENILEAEIYKEFLMANREFK